MIQPFVDVLTEEFKEDPKVSDAEKAFFRPFTKTNAYVISSKAQHMEITLITGALCERIMREPVSD